MHAGQQVRVGAQCERHVVMARAPAVTACVKVPAVTVLELVGLLKGVGK